MRETTYYTISAICVGITYIEQLIPIIQFILLLFSLIFTLMGIIRQIKEKWKKGEDISNEIKQATEQISEVANKINNIKDGEQNGRGKNEG